MNRKAITIIDVVVVLVILIALVMFVFVPQYHRRREVACRTSCVGNLKNIGLLCKMYSQEHNDVWPSGLASGDSTRLNLYLLFDTGIADNAEVLICPSSQTEFPPRIPTPEDLRNIDYAYLDGPAEAYNDQLLSESVVAGDGWDGHSNPTLGNWTHNEGSNLLWGDGHVLRHRSYVGTAPGSSWPDVK